MIIHLMVHCCLVAPAIANPASLPRARLSLPTGTPHGQRRPSCSPRCLVAGELEGITSGGDDHQLLRSRIQGMMITYNIKGDYND